MIDVENVPTRSVAASRAQADKLLLRELAASIPGTPRRSRRRLLVLGSVTVVGLTGATAAAAFTMLVPEHASTRDSARCYASASNDDGADFPGTTVSIATPDDAAGTDVPPKAIEICSDLWRRGFLTSDGFKAPEAVGPDGLPPADKAVPPLVACVLKSGQAAVFPGDARICDELGLPLLGETESPTNR